MAPKGTGSENMSFLRMWVPADGMKGIKHFVLESIFDAGGNPCPPGIVGMGMAARATTRVPAKEATSGSRIAQRRPGRREARSRALRPINETGIGPMGLGGDVTAIQSTSSRPTRT